MENNNKRPDTINTLLDIERFSGESEGRMAPMLMFLCVSGVPPLIYIYFFLGIIPFFWVVPLFLFITIRAAMIILGEESKRVAQYKQQLYDEYSSIFDIMNIKTIHDDGLVEYTNNRVTYFIVAQNGGIIDPVARAQITKRIISSLGSDYTIDIRGQNIIDTDDLTNRYSGVQLFGDRSVAEDYLAIIDYNRKIIREETLITRIVFPISGRRSDFKKMRKAIESLLYSNDAKAFKSMVLADKELAEDIISRDIDTYIDFQEIRRKKHSESKYHTSRVVEYDYSTEEKADEEVTVERGFMRHE